MSEIKIFRVTGKIMKPNFRTNFTMEVVATKPEHAIEQIYANIGSKHRAKRYQIKIHKIEEVNPEEAKNPIIQKLIMRTT